MTFNLLARPLRYALLAVLLTGPVVAQQAAPAPGGPGSVSLTTTPPTPTHLAAARELMEQVGAARLFDAFIPNMQIQITNLVTRTRPELGADLKSALTAIAPEFEKQKAQLQDSAVVVFARSMTEQELKDTLVFLHTAAGQKFLDTQGQAVNTVAIMLDQWNRQLSVEMYDRVRAEMKKNGHDL